MSTPPSRGPRPSAYPDSRRRGDTGARPRQEVEVRVRKDGSVRAVLTLSPQAGSGGKRVPLTPDDLHWGVRALSVELRTLLYAKLDESRPHVPTMVHEAPEDSFEGEDPED